MTIDRLRAVEPSRSSTPAHHLSACGFSVVGSETDGAGEDESGADDD